MENLSKKATVVLEVLKRLEATSADNRTNIYSILEELEKLSLKEIFPEEDDYELDCIRCEMSQKSVSTTLAALVRGGYVYKTDISSVKTKDGTKNIRSYYLTDKAL